MKYTSAAALLLGFAPLLACDSEAPVLPSTPPDVSEGAPVSFGGPSGHADFAEVTLSRSAVAEGFTADDEWRVSPPLSAPGGATRVGVLIHLAVPGDMPQLEAAGIDERGATTGFLPLVQTFAEDGSFVAVAELGTTVQTARLRLLASDIDRLDQLVWNAVVPGSTGDAGLGQVQGALSASLSALGVVSRSAWKAKSTKCTTSDAAKTRMAVHYTVTPSDNPAARVRSIQAYHMDSLGWCDIGYHFLVGTDGSIYEGRPLSLLGAHVGGQNTGNVGVSFIGCFHPSGCSSWPPVQPPEVMLGAGATLLDALSTSLGVPLDETHVKAHRDHAGQSTDCPGDNLYVRIPDLLAMPATPPPDPEPEPDPTPDPEPDPTPDDPPPASSCASKACGQCTPASGCGWCASKGACQSASAACTWGGSLDGDTCWTELWPCWAASCWNPEADLAKCGTWAIDEDFSSGAYSVHRYWATLPGGGVTTLRLQRTGGTFSPALIVTDNAGALIAAGDVAPLHPGVTVTGAISGHSGGVAEVSLHAPVGTAVLVYVTGWSVLDAGWGGWLPKSTQYHLSAVHDCKTTPPPPGDPTDPVGATWAGLSQSGSEIPRAGLANPTLAATLGMDVEPLGEVVDAGGHEWVRGKVSWFGGPDDTWTTPTETGAITGELLRELNDPTNPTAEDLQTHPEDYYYCAMRWSYTPNGTWFWKDARVLVMNPATGSAAVLRPLDWGPNLSTGRVLDVSPQAMADLWLTTDDEALVSFAPPGTPLGPVGK